MKKRNLTALLSGGVLSGILLSVVSAAPPANAAQGNPSGGASAQPATYMGLTEPSVSVKLGFNVRGVVDKIDVKRNDKVKAGQPLLALLDKEEQATLNALKLKADLSLAVAEAEQTYNLKKLDYEKKKSLYENKEARGSASQFEVQTAEVEMNIAKIKIEEAKHEGATNQAQADAQAARIEQMHKLSPIDGEIRDVIVKVGEQVDETKPVIEIVDLDPLYVEVKLVDTNVVQKLKLGDKVQVKYADESQWRTAEVESIDPSADSRTQTHPFRLKLPNPENRTAGLRVEIQLAPSVAKAE